MRKNFVKTLDNQLYLSYNNSQMRLTVDPNGERPIYEQIELQIKEQIICGELERGTMLPSIRMLAKELKIGIITAKRAYDDLTAEGFTESVAGKGVFVSFTDKNTLVAAGEEAIKKQIVNCVKFARANGIGREDFQRILENVWEEN